jgi:hypothetical protein
VQEVAKREQELAAELRALPERRRRTFRRYVASLQSNGGEEANKKLEEMKDKYGKEDLDGLYGINMDDLDEDFDELGINSEEDGAEESE